MIIPTFQPGDRLSARALNALWAAVRRLGKVDIAAPAYVTVDQAGMSTYVLPINEVWWIQLSSGTGGAYAWTRVIPGTTAGTWITSPGGESGTTTSDPAYEANGNTGVASGTYAEAWREPSSGSLIFQLGTCGS